MDFKETDAVVIAKHFVKSQSHKELRPETGRRQERKKLLMTPSSSLRCIRGRAKHASLYPFQPYRVLH
jgi:hypothetical protein